MASHHAVGLILRFVRGTVDGMRQRNRELELNQAITSLADFLESYNQSIPAGFPRASVKVLKQFQEAYPILFKRGDEWSIDRHRKRLLDWLLSHPDAAA
jgi:hypothetical protein